MTEGVHKLGEVLRAAREAKGVDLVRVERDTKIRERYLSALERGEFRELPGAVYTKGFLRNYGAYLGLDPDYLIDLYRLESSAAMERTRGPAAPRPLSAKRSRAFVVTPGAVVAAILTLLVGGFVAYLGYEFVNFARTPELRITTPAGNVSGHTELTITVRGTTEPNARVTVSGLPENPTVEADELGNFEMTVVLVPGSNVMELTATDPATGRDSETEERTIVVVSEVAGSPSPAAGTLAVDQPVADATLAGRVPVAGTATAGAAIEVTATLVAAAEPTFRVTDAAGAAVALDPADPTPPEPLPLTADGAGAFAGELGLGPGTWEVTVTTPGIEPVSRRVTVTPGEGLAGSLRIAGGDSYLELDQDGAPVAGVSGGIVADGETIELDAERDLRIRVGNAGAVRVTLNGINLGAMGANGAVVEWRITGSGG